MYDIKVFAARLTEARRAAGLTQAQAAKMAGVSPTAWATWEQGRSFPPVPRLDEICRVVNVPFNQLVEERPSKNILLANEIASLDPDNRYAVVQIVKSISSVSKGGVEV